MGQNYTLFLQCNTLRTCDSSLLAEGQCNHWKERAKSRNWEIELKVRSTRTPPRPSCTAPTLSLRKQPVQPATKS